MVQLWHVGRISHVDLQPDHGAPVAPSAIKANAQTVLIRNGQAQRVDTSEPRGNQQRQQRMGTQQQQ